MNDCEEKRLNWRGSVWLALILGLLVSLPAPGGLVVIAEDHDEEEEEVAMPSTKEVYEFLKESFPEAYRELMLARDEDPVEDFQAALTRAADFVFEYREIAIENPKGAELFLAIERARLIAYGIADRYHAAEGESERNRYRQELKAAAVALFEAQIREQEHELKVLREEIDDLSAITAERKANREAEIDELFHEFLEDGDGDEDEEDED